MANRQIDIFSSLVTESCNYKDRFILQCLRIQSYFRKHRFRNQEDTQEALDKHRTFGKRKDLDEEVLAVYSKKIVLGNEELSSQATQRRRQYYIGKIPIWLSRAGCLLKQTSEERVHRKVNNKNFSTQKATHCERNNLHQKPC